MTKTHAAPKGDALPDLSGDDEVHSEPTKIGDGLPALEESIRASLANPPERATSKMTPFQLEDVLQKLAESPPERRQARMKALSQRPTAPVIDVAAAPPAEQREPERVTVPDPIPAPPVVAARPPLAAPPTASGGGWDIAAIVTVVIAAVFVVLTCAVVFAR